MPFLVPMASKFAPAGAIACPAYTPTTGGASRDSASGCDPSRWRMRPVSEVAISVGSVGAPATQIFVWTPEVLGPCPRSPEFEYYRRPHIAARDASIHPERFLNWLVDVLAAYREHEQHPRAD